MTLHDLLFVESSPLKMAVNVTGKHKAVIVFGSRPFPQDLKTFVRNRLPIQFQTVPVEPPGLSRLAGEPFWIRQIVIGISRLR